MRVTTGCNRREPLNSSQLIATCPQLPPTKQVSYTTIRAVVVVEGATVGFHRTEATTMFLFAPFLVIGAIAFFC